MKELTLIKIGGNIVDDENALSRFLDIFSRISSPKLLVHGGGKLATQLQVKLGIPVKMEEGRRITCEETLKVTTMVYAGLINKQISARLNALGEKAMGLCGADLFMIPSKKRKVATTDFGYVGDVVVSKIKTREISWLLNKGITPIIAPVTADATGQLLNTNADTIASSLATALSAQYKVNLLYGFEKEGVLNGQEIIRSIDPEKYRVLKENKIITDGMIPKLDNAFAALSQGVSRVIIGNAVNLDKLILNHAGTHLTA